MLNNKKHYTQKVKECEHESNYCPKKQYIKIRCHKKKVLKDTKSLNLNQHKELQGTNKCANHYAKSDKRFIICKDC